jgi:hypothetical protein
VLKKSLKINRVAILKVLSKFIEFQEIFILLLMLMEI